MSISTGDDRARPRAVRRVARRTIIGEIGFFRQGERSATVTAATPAVLYALERPAFERMVDDAPQLATRFTANVIRTMSDRLEFANRELAAMTDA